MTVFGLRVLSSSALACLPRTRLGLTGTLPLPGLDVEWPEGSDIGTVCGAGISSHSSPSKFLEMRKKGHILTSILSESWASAKEMGTGDDLIIAAVISSEGRARLLRVVVAVAEPAGFEKSLQSFNERIKCK